MSDTPRTDALFGDWLLGKISANQLLRSVCQIEKELTETKKQIIEGAEHLEETKKLLANSVSEQHELQNIAFKLDLQLRAAQEKLDRAGQIETENETLKKQNLSMRCCQNCEYGHPLFGRRHNCRDCNGKNWALSSKLAAKDG